MLKKDAFYRERVWPGWLKELATSPKRVLLIHGIMGSELYDDSCDDTVWVDFWIWHRASQLEYSVLTPDGAIDIDGHMLYARSTVHPPIIKAPYSDFLGSALKPGGSIMTGVKASRSSHAALRSSWN